DGVGMVYEAASGPVRALQEISFAVERGEFVALVGPSGCGKSTLLRLVAGLRLATTGRVSVGGRPVTRPIPEVGMVFQAPVLLKWRTILDNVLLPAELSGRDRSQYRGRGEELLRLGRPQDLRRKASAGAVGRHPAARLALSRPSARPAPAPDGRALRRARRDDP